MSYHIFKMFDGMGLRYLGNAQEPFKWVTRDRDAYEFNDPTRTIDKLERSGVYGAQYVEVDDPWAGPGGR